MEQYMKCRVRRGQGIVGKASALTFLPPCPFITLLFLLLLGRTTTMHRIVWLSTDTHGDKGNADNSITHTFKRLYPPVTIYLSIVTLKHTAALFYSFYLVSLHGARPPSDTHTNSATPFVRLSGIQLLGAGARVRGEINTVHRIIRRPKLCPSHRHVRFSFWMDRYKILLLAE